MVGFSNIVSRPLGTPFDVREWSNGNQSHEYGVTLQSKGRMPRLEYMRAL